MEEPTVSIFMLTYNQQEYIAQAIDGVLRQETNFQIELVIGDDFSTDGTRKICQEYALKNPKKIKLLLNERNLGLGANYVKTLAECNGKYIAICDGDDYWTDPLKLQKQVDFLKSHPDFKIVFTNNKNVYPTGKDDVRNEDEIPVISSFKDMVKANYIASVTVMFKNTPLSKEMKELIKDLPYGDWPTYLWVLREGGKIKFLKDITAVYRKDFGTSILLRSNKSRIGEINLWILQKLRNDINFKPYDFLLKERCLNYKTSLMSSYIKEKRYFESLKYFVGLLFVKPPCHILKVYLYSFKRTFQK